MNSAKNLFGSVFYRDKFSKVDDGIEIMVTVNDLFKYHVACFVYKHVNNQLPPCFENIFLKLGMLDLVKLYTIYICRYKKTCLTTNYLFFLGGGGLIFGILISSKKKRFRAVSL